MNIVTRKQISVQDWDALVEKTYGKIYSFQQQDGCKSRGVETISTTDLYDYENDTIPELINGPEMGVSFKAWLERDPKAPLNPSSGELKTSNYYFGFTEKDEQKYKTNSSNIRMFWERNFYPHASMIADDLCKKGLLKQGEYDIKIDW